MIKPIRIENILLDQGLNLEIPYFSKEDVPDYYCSRYARLSSEFIFGNKFPIAHAWKMREKKIISHKEIDYDFFKNKDLEKGSLVGIFFQNSRAEILRDQYSHIALYLGRKKGKPLFLEQFNKIIRVMNLERYKEENLIFREILTLKK